MDFLSRLIPPARWRLMCLVLLVISVLCCLTSYVVNSAFYQNAAVVCLALAVGGTFSFWRCPRCRRVLPLMNMMYLKECPKCRSDIRNFKY